MSEDFIKRQFCKISDSLLHTSLFLYENGTPFAFRVRNAQGLAMRLPIGMGSQTPHLTSNCIQTGRFYLLEALNRYRP